MFYTCSIKVPVVYIKAEDSALHASRLAESSSQHLLSHMFYIAFVIVRFLWWLDKKTIEPLNH